MKKVILIFSFSFIGYILYGQGYNKNKYDYIGVAHNEILTEYYKDSEINKNLTMQEAMDKIIMLSYNNNIVKSINGTTKLKYEWATARNYEIVASDYANNFSNIINKTSLGQVAKELILELFKKAESGDFNNLENFYREINSLEDKIMQSRLKEFEEVILLGSCSVARHSAFLAFGKSGLTYSSENKAKKGDPWRVVADIVGGAIGGTASGLGSTLTGGALVGTIAIATIGGASAGTGLYDKWFGDN